MKKTLSMLTVLALVISLAAGPLTAVFAENSSAGDGQTDPEYVRFTGTGFDPYASFEFSDNGQYDTIDPDSVRWAAIRHRTAARYNENNVEYIAQFYVIPAAEPFIPAHYIYSGEWETTILDMTSVAALYGRESIWDSDHYTAASQIRLDPLEPDRDAENFDDSTGRGIVTEGHYVDIAWIAFFEKEEDARAYTGSEDTPYCLLDANSLSSPFMIHNLNADYMGGQGEDPSATDAPVEISGPSALFALNYEDELNDLLFAGNRNLIEDVSFNDNCYLISVSAGGDQNMDICFGTLAADGYIDAISADENKVVQLAVRIDPEAGGVNGNLYWQTDEHPGYSEPQNAAYKYDNTTDIQVVNIDFTKVKRWEGSVGNLRFDPFPETKEDTEVELYYIAFFTNLESAEAYAEKFLAEGLPATPAPTEKPTAAPTAEPTEAPTAAPTDAQATDAPATDAPATEGKGNENNGDSKDDQPKKGIPTGAVIGIVAGAVAVVAAICAVVVVKSKKK